MPEMQKSAQSASRFPIRWRWITGIAIALVIALVIVVAVQLTGGTPQDVGAPQTSGSPGASPSAGATPSAEDGDGDPVDASPSPEAASPAPSQPAPSVIPLDAPADALPGVEVTIKRLEAVDGVAQGPGDVGGPSIRFAVVVTNNTPNTVSLQTTTVTADYGPDRSPATELDQPGGSPLAGQLASGETAEGIYIFNVPVEARDQVRITVDYSVDVAPLAFEGPAPR